MRAVGGNECYLGQVTIGVPKEIKVGENRVGLAVGGARELAHSGHKVLIQKSAGEGSGISDRDFIEAGAELVETLTEVYERAEMIIKVKEPQPVECEILREGQILYAYLHLAAAPELAEVLCERRVKAVAYETIQDAFGALPLLRPMSEVAGRIAVQVGASFLQNNNGGSGILLGGVTGTQRGRVTIIGGGVVGTNAAQISVGLGAKVTILDINPVRLEYLAQLFDGRVTTLFSNAANIAESVRKADLVIGAVLIPGKRAPVLVTRKMIARMRPRSVVVDVDVDQGGCIETTRPTTHAEPTFTVEGVLHYCVPNMPGIVAATATEALTNATYPYAESIAARGLEGALAKSAPLRYGLNVYDGNITCEAVAEALSRRWVPYEA